MAGESQCDRQLARLARGWLSPGEQAVRRNAELARCLHATDNLAYVASPASQVTKKRTECVKNQDSGWEIVQLVNMDVPIPVARKGPCHQDD